MSSYKSEVDGAVAFFGAVAIFALVGWIVTWFM